MFFVMSIPFLNLFYHLTELFLDQSGQLSHVKKAPTRFNFKSEPNK